MPACVRFVQCRAISCGTGIYGTAEISQVLLNCVFAIVRMPASRARPQFFFARGPGPTTEIEYSPISVFIPPRSMDAPLTDAHVADVAGELGNQIAARSSVAIPSPN